MGNPFYEALPQEHETKFQQLDLLRANLARAPYPGYPPFEQRLFAQMNDLLVDSIGRLVLPDGSWAVNTHPNRRDIEAQPTPEIQASLMLQGLILDAHGRPLHPWFQDMLEDPTIGIVTGKGAYWNWGPNRTVDPIVICKDHILLVRRKDTGNWSLPGGFQDDGELPIYGAVRETWEETRVVIPDLSLGRLVYQGPVIDTRVTAHAWPETSAYVFELTEFQNPTAQESEVADTSWLPIHEVLLGGILFGSHRILIERAIQHSMGI